MSASSDSLLSAPPPAAAPFAAWLDAAPAAAVVVRTADGTLAFANAAAQDMAGAAALDALAARAWAAWRAGDAPPRSVLGSTLHGLRWAPDPSGAWLVVWCVPEPAADAPHIPLAGQLAAAQKHGGRIGVWACELPSGAGQWDEQVARCFGLDPDAGTPDLAQAVQCIHPDDRADAISRWEASIAAGSAGEARFRVSGADGAVKVLHSLWQVERDAQGNACRAAGVVIDDTETHRLAQGFGELGSRFEFAADLAGIAIWRYDLADDRIYWDERFFRMMGMEPHARGIPLAELRAMVHPDDADDLQRATLAALQGAGPVDTETRYLRADGTERVFMTRRGAGHDAQGRVVGLYGVSLDVTERRSAERRWRYAVEGNGDALWERDVTTGRIFYSDRFQALLGYAPGEFSDAYEEWASRVHPDDLNRVAADMHRYIAGASELYVAEYRIRCKDGDWKWMLDRGHAVDRDAGGRALRIVGTMIDLTERKRAEEALDAVQARISLATRAVGMGIWERDLIAGRSLWDAQMYALRGLASDDPRTPDALRDALVHPDDRASVHYLTRKAIEEGVPYTHEFRVVWPDGSLRWLASRGQVVRDASGRPVRMLGVNWDVSERKLAEDSLLATQQRMALATQSAGIGLWERDVAQQRSYWDAQMYRLLGLEPDDPRPPDELRALMVPAADLERLDQMQARTAATGLTQAIEFRVVLPDRAERWLAVRAMLPREAAGAMPRVVGVCWDVTESRRAQAALRDKEAAERASLAKSEFLSRMSHELRTPLNAILGFTQLLQVDHAAPPSAAQAERLDRIYGASWHLLTLINDVLDLARIEAGGAVLVREPVRLDEIVFDALQMVEPQVREHALCLENDIPPGLAVWSDRTRLRQVLLNLLSNAVKYNIAGGHVALRAQVQGERVSIAVRDTGCGIAPERMHELFEPFNRLGAERGSIGGTGIGLAIARTLVEQMGGAIEVESTPGVGSEFRLVLDLAHAREPLRDAPTAVRAESPAAAVRAHVVYIEDNPINTLLVEELLAQRPGIVLDTAVDGQSGVALVERVRPDLVLVDMQLPDIDGDEVFRRLRANPDTAQVLCIALSANAMERDIKAAKELGFHDYWTKPIDVVGFLTRIDELFAR